MPNIPTAKFLSIACNAFLRLAKSCVLLLTAIVALGLLLSRLQFLPVQLLVAYAMLLIPLLNMAFSFVFYRFTRSPVLLDLPLRILPLSIM